METTRNRIRIAQLSARIIVEEGVREYAVAKRKAAQRLGLDWGQNLPDDESVTAALQEYHRIFRFHKQPGFIRRLRQIALEVMEFLGGFAPRLSGAVLEGTAGELQPITLHLFPDTPEEVIWHLVTANIRYREEPDLSVELDGKRTAIPMLSFDWRGTRVEAWLYPPKALRQNPKHGPRRASIRALQRLLAEESGNQRASGGR
ncbi:MAG TPA: hypothetical protein ENI90_08645 [Methylothermaceae bacterium]|nr:hypothetical protein [Methylothermaceae bacterium]